MAKKPRSLEVNGSRNTVVGEQISGEVKFEVNVTGRGSDSGVSIGAIYTEQIYIHHIHVNIELGGEDK